jgi:competence CoiA-like predicted nuclease
MVYRHNRVDCEIRLRQRLTQFDVRLHLLVAEFQSNRVTAGTAAKGLAYFCPNCKKIVILKRGRIVTAHFSHKPPTNCSWARGETQAHLEAKQIVFDGLQARGVRTLLEYVVDTLPGDRRADVMAWSATNAQLAIELQHTSIGIPEIEARAHAYSRAGIAQIWLPFLSGSALSAAEPKSAGTLFIQKYSPRPFEKWVHGFCGGDGMWMYVPEEKSFRHAKMVGHQTYVEATSWFGPGGVEESAGGFYKWSKRYRELTLSRPHTIQELAISTKTRGASSMASYIWPAGTVATFVPA